MPAAAAYAVRLPPPTAATAAAATGQHRLGAGANAIITPGSAGRRPGSALSGEQGGRERILIADRIGGGGGDGGSGGGRQRPRTSTGSRSPVIVELLPPLSTTAKVPPSPYPPSSRPSSSPRRLNSGRGSSGRAGRGRGGDAGATTLIVPTVSLCLGDDDDYGMPADACPDGHHRFPDDGARFSHYIPQASPASLLAKAAAATRTFGDRVTSGGRTDAADDGGCYGFGGGIGDCIRPAEAVQADVEKRTARPHGFRRWRPGEARDSV